MVKEEETTATDISKEASIAAESIALEGDVKPAIRFPALQARAHRLEQNRKAAQESRRRKKIMVDELHRSVIFFSRANEALKVKNEELSRLLIRVKAQVEAIERGESVDTSKNLELEVVNAAASQAVTASATDRSELAFAQEVATQAIFESQGYTAVAARTAAQTISGRGPTDPAVSMPMDAVSNGSQVPEMQTGATMQAMASFQHAATAAMKEAMKGMQGIAGMNMIPSPITPLENTQREYRDAMTAIAMHKAATAAAAAAVSQLTSQGIVTWSQPQDAEGEDSLPAEAATPAEREDTKDFTTVSL